MNMKSTVDRALAKQVGPLPDGHPSVRIGKVGVLLINLGTPETRLLADGWTVITADKKPSAQFEHTLVVTPKGYDILTL